MSIVSQYPFDLYLKHGYENEPTKFDHDIYFKDQKIVSLDSKTVAKLRQDGFQIAINVKAVDFYDNAFFDNELKVEFHKVSYLAQSQDTSEETIISGTQSVDMGLISIAVVTFVGLALAVSSKKKQVNTQHSLMNQNVYTAP